MIGHFGRVVRQLGSPTERAERQRTADHSLSGADARPDGIGVPASRPPTILGR